MKDLHGVLDHWREANARLKTIVVTTGAALVFLCLLALVQLLALLSYHATLRDLRQDVERTRQEAFDTMQREGAAPEVSDADPVPRLEMKRE